MHKKFRIYLPWIGLLLIAAATVTILIDHPVTALVWSALLVNTLDAALLRGQIKRLISRDCTREDNGGYAPFPITIQGGELAQLVWMNMVEPWVPNHCHFDETHVPWELKVELINLGIERITSSFAVPHLRVRGYRGATAQELFAFVLKYPETNRDNEILAVGEMGWDKNYDRILGYRRNVGKSEVVSYCIDERRSVNVKFLVVPLDKEDL